jgi:hypothetical protein
MMRSDATPVARTSTALAAPVLCLGLFCFGTGRAVPTDPVPLPSDGIANEQSPPIELASPATAEGSSGSQAAALGGGLHEISLAALAQDLSVPDEGDLQPQPMMPVPQALEFNDSCSGLEPGVSVLERVRRSLAVTACASSAWLDGLFGDQLRYDDYRATYGTVSLGTLYSQYDGFDPRLRFKLRLQLPQWDERISAFAGRVDRDEFISDSENDFDALPTRQFGSMAQDESVLLGLGYASPKRDGNDFDVSLGVRVDVPLDPYVRTRWEMTRAFAESYVFSTRQTFFWQNSEGLGTTTRLTLDRVLSPRLLARLSGVGKFTEETDGMEWTSQMTMFQSVNPRTGLAWQGELRGATDNEVAVTNRALRLIMRRQMSPEWLFIELRGGVEWPRQRLTEEREAGVEVGIAFDMQFGSKRERR